MKKPSFWEKLGIPFPARNQVFKKKLDFDTRIQGRNQVFGKNSAFRFHSEIKFSRKNLISTLGFREEAKFSGKNSAFCSHPEIKFSRKNLISTLGFREETKFSRKNSVSTYSSYSTFSVMRGSPGRTQIGQTPPREAAYGIIRKRAIPGELNLRHG